jgi:DNA-binding NarL/FixJ family response regulator
VRERIFIIGAVRAWGELLRERIDRDGGFDAVGVAADGDEALHEIERLDSPPDIVLIDVDVRLALTIARRLRGRHAAVRVAVLGLDDDPTQVLAWAIAGATGLVARTASLAELLNTLAGMARGEAPCSSGLTSALLRGVEGSGSGLLDARSDGRLTRREREVARLVAEGSTNKEIATDLHIELGTVKSHVHSVIHKLGVSRRAQVAAQLTGDELESDWRDSLASVGVEGRPAGR